jgi:hypothetical protein
MNPLTVSPGVYNSGVSQVREMSRDLWLAIAKDVCELTDTDFATVHLQQKP